MRTSQPHEPPKLGTPSHPWSTEEKVVRMTPSVNEMVVQKEVFANLPEFDIQNVGLDSDNVPIKAPKGGSTCRSQGGMLLESSVRPCHSMPLVGEQGGGYGRGERI